MKYSCLIILLFSLYSCENGVPKNVKESLEWAGDNRAELEKVIAHYQDPKDSLKLKSAYFLISNMPGKYYYQGNLLNHFYEFVVMQGSKKDLDSMTKFHGAFNTNRLEIKYDIKELKASFLIDNIDMAFKVWREQPWGEKINFTQFCEYILPYRVGNEIPDYNRAEIYERYNYNKALAFVRNKKGDALQACFAINDVLKKEGWHFNPDGGFLPSFSARKLLVQKNGNCRDMVAKTVFVMRALGIPVGSQFTPNWGNRSGGHLWNVVLDKKGKNHNFMGLESNITKDVGDVNVNYTFPKSFQNMFSRQGYSSNLLADTKNDTPDFFKNSLIKDVTSENIDSKDISIQLNEPNVQNFKYAYICVFDNVNWTPVHWGKASKNKAIFKKMMSGITYLTAYFKDGTLIPASYPFTLMKNGSIKYLIPDKSVQRTAILYRKYHMFMKGEFAKRMKDGKFQASDNPNFTNAVTFYTIPYPEVEMKWYDIPVKLSRSYKYYRYLSPNGCYGGNMAELRFYSKGVKVTGEIIGTEGSYNNNTDNTFKNAMDGDEVTFFDYNKPDNGWVGLKCNTAIEVDQFQFLPRNDDNGIDVGQNYELFYWENNQWVSLGMRIADDNKLVYKNAPANALFLLRNHSKGKEERIFTYENEKQIWW